LQEYPSSRFGAGAFEFLQTGAYRRLESPDFYRRPKACRIIFDQVAAIGAVIPAGGTPDAPAARKKSALSCGYLTMFHNISYANPGTANRQAAFDAYPGFKPPQRALTGASLSNLRKHEVPL
jgi:hypothetical protein